MDRTAQNETSSADTGHHQNPPSEGRVFRDAIDRWWADHYAPNAPYPPTGTPARRPHKNPIQRFARLADLEPAQGGTYYVYFIRGGDLVKIGISRTPKERFQELRKE